MIATHTLTKENLIMARIINYHEIRDQNWFEQSLITLKAMYPTGTLHDVEAFYNGEQKDFFHITVDDGDVSNYHTIYPTIKKLGLTATIFVSPHMAKTGKNFWFQEIEGYNQDFLRNIIADKFGINKENLKNFYVRSMLKCMRLDDIEEIINIYKKKHNPAPQPRRNMNIEELKELHNSGFFNIGAHTMTHPILANETDAGAKWQIENSVAELSDILNTEIKHFAYPNGDSSIDFGQREIEILKNTSVKYAYSFDFKKMKTSDNHYSIPRFGLFKETPAQIKRKMQYGELWEEVKKIIGLNSETKHRRLIKKHTNFIQ